VTITSDLARVVQDAVAAQREILTTQLPGLVDPRDLLVNVRPRDRAFDVIVQRATEQITTRLRPLAPAADAAVRRELIRGVAVGSNPRATAARMVERAGGEFDGGLTRALVISRTETLDAHRAAAKARPGRAGRGVGRLDLAVPPLAADLPVVPGQARHLPRARRARPGGSPAGPLLPDAEGEALV
jgi:hypothetical protein